MNSKGIYTTYLQSGFCTTGSLLHTTVAGFVATTITTTITTR
ncbi:MAG TPA: hypothetical protein VLC98_06215 [Phnomibacter sp.]|nr:hypothetical protein [Phnomibacter sp.]